MKPRIRLLLLIADLSGGGSERQCSLLARHLSRRDFEIHLGLWRDVFDYDAPGDVELHRLEKSRPWHVVRAIRQTRRLVEDLRPDMVYSQLHYVNMVTGTALGRCAPRPRWICRQVNDPKREMKGPFAIWARRALRRADRVICGSAGVAVATLDHLCLAEDRVVKIDNLADVENIDRRSREPLSVPRKPGVFTVLHVGRLHPQKNQDMLLEAFRSFRGKGAELWMLGKGPLESHLRRRAESLGISHQVRWLGFRANPYPFFRAADCCVLSSDYEGMPNAAIEAMICATPTVATRCRYGPEELIDDGVDGLLVPVANPREAGGCFAMAVA